ncbi:DUF4194 domain-containing protein [Diplocloster agilis]|uniref:DUF4194 domain-containing protein n=1 Tax=Diplocloster agilis TaxID=2850323 RepID=UPI00082326E2|nr:DUF4194 domain-containing protein [Suonthocola fibrivorans]MCU6734030.1 DUF4194 domain-containing protein [Suonthocola fibrivorans]SCJ19963.1 Uncharacterised protein [uncultured Clostridium sp.]
MAVDLREETANYLLNNCFLIGTLENMREKYFDVINHEADYRELFRPLGYTLVIHKALRVVQVISRYPSGRVELKKYESILLLILRLLYVQKRESLSTNENQVLVTVEEIKDEYDKLSFPRKLDQQLLTDGLRTLKRYNLAAAIDKLGDLTARIQVYPSVMLAMPETPIKEAAEKTREYLLLYTKAVEEGDQE